MLEVIEVQRIFKFDDNGKEMKLADPDPAWLPQKVLNHYTPMYPILGTATIVLKGIENDQEVVEFVSTIGTKS
jgi:PRTRC genetic system protein C